MFQSKLKLAVSSVLCGSFFLFSPVSHAAQNDGLVAQWSFDDCTAKDVSGNGHDGTINGNPVCVDGKKGKAFSFDGTKDFVDVGNVLTKQCQFTFSTWVNVAKREIPMPQYFGIWGQQKFSYPPTSSNDISFSNYVFFIGDSQESFGSSSNWNDGEIFDTRVSHVIPINDWHLITQTYDGKSIKQFDNGKLINTLQSEGHCLGNNDNFLIAKTASYPEFLYTSYFDGSIDDFRIYNRALSETEIQALYNDTSGISGNINGVQKYNAICKNLKTQQTKKIAVTDGAKPWDCTAAGLKAKKGENVSVTIMGVAK